MVYIADGPKMKYRILAGYCALCRAEEIKRYGTLVEGRKHFAACKAAGCKHPVRYYLKDTRLQGVSGSIPPS